MKFFLNNFFFLFICIYFDVTSLTPRNAKHDKLPYIKEGKNLFFFSMRERERERERERKEIQIVVNWNANVIGI